jgi:universal stress protein E
MLACVSQGQQVARPRSEILVAIHSPHAPPHLLLKKAAVLARAQNAKLHLAHIIVSPYSAVAPGDDDTGQAACEELERRREQLAKVAKYPAFRGIPLSTSVAWDYPASDALVRVALKRKPALLLVESQRRGRLSRLLLTHTDWELIRNSPCPVWLSKSQRIARHPRVLAAIDPVHAHTKPAALDHVILQQAVTVAGNPNRVHACHVYLLPNQPRFPDGAVEAYWLAATEAEQLQHCTPLERAVLRTLSQHDVPARNFELVNGTAADQIVKASKRLRADVLVMGAASRSALERLFIGHTAERVIDEVACDVVIVKARNFKTQVEQVTHPLMRLPHVSAIHP